MFRILHTMVLFLAGVTFPFGHTNVEIGPVVMTPTKVATALLAALVTFQFAMERRRGRIFGAKAAWTCVFALAVVVGAVHSILDGLPVSNVLNATATWLSLLAMYGVLAYTLDSPRSIDVLLAAYCIGSTYVVVTGLLGEGFQTVSAEGTRIGGEGGNPNRVAFHLLLAIPAALAAMSLSARRWARPLWAGAAVLFVVGVGATLSRAGLLAMVLMGGLWLVRSRRFDLLRFAIPVLAIVAVAIAFMPDTVSERLATLDPTNARRDTSIQSRVEALPLALGAFASSPLIGVGLLGFLQWAAEHGASSLNVVHNAYLDVAVDLGLLGLVPFLVITILSWVDLRRAWKLARRANRTRDAVLLGLGRRATMMQIALFGMLIVAQFQPAMRYRALWMTFALSSVLLRLVRRRVIELGALPATSEARAPVPLPTPARA